MKLAKCLLLGAAFIVSSPRLLEATEEKHELPSGYARHLVHLQDLTAHGNREASASAAACLLQLIRSVEFISETGLRDPKLGHALAIHLLSGGPSRIIRRLVERNVDLGRWKNIVVALLAYAEENREAGSLLDQLNARELDAGIAGHIALAQAMANSDVPHKAKAYLREAKLLTPGGMIEDAAWRREILLDVSSGEQLLAVQAASRYLWRFGTSVYAHDVVQFLATSVVPDLLASSQGRVAVAALFSEVSVAARGTYLMAAASEAMVRGKFETVAYAAEQALTSTVSGSAERFRAEAFAALAQGFIDPTSTAADKLRAVSSSALSTADRRLLHVSLVVLERIRAPVQANAVPVEAVHSAAVEKAARTIATAQVLLDPHTR